ncbi:hypothetical protein DESPIG_01710 [Desulfovibrio piger ATCC 29098]|uniref:Uncharacterized protein n=1 Tax=Desulfovibrio piger ATCC 29098 TaxID=411464 RepID=B6WUF2_9BACT|nr:hypothetical protein DESPIG_01710 [Desulfovibrio piger ATCC 29098]
MTNPGAHNERSRSMRSGFPAFSLSCPLQALPGTQFHPCPPDSDGDR